MFVDLHPWTQLDVAHAFAGTLKQAGRIRQGGAVEEADRRVAGERIDVSEGGIADAGGWHVVVEGFAHVFAKCPHMVEPRLDHYPHRVGEVEPRLYRRVADDRAGKQEQGVRAGQGGYSAAGT